MKKLLFICSFFVLTCFESCIVYEGTDEGYRVWYVCNVVNQSPIDILVYDAGGNHFTPAVYPDTLLPEVWRYDFDINGSPDAELPPMDPCENIVAPGDTFPVLPTMMSKYTRWLFKSYYHDGYYSVFIIDGQKVLDKGWDAVRRDNDVIVRYDLTYDDLILLDKTIPYPPTEDMKEMKMWPPYTSVVSKEKD